MISSRTRETYTSVLQVAWAIAGLDKEPTGEWEVYLLWTEVADDSEAITRAKACFLQGEVPQGKGGFEPTKDAWLLYAAYGPGGEGVAVEVLDPFDYADPGAVLGVHEMAFRIPVTREQLLAWIEFDPKRQRVLYRAARAEQDRRT